MTKDPQWKGDEVAPAPAGRAEKQAELAEGNERVPADDPRARRASGEPPPRPPAPAAGADDEENLREKREAAAEEHREREATGEPPFGKKL